MRDTNCEIYAKEYDDVDIEKFEVYCFILKCDEVLWAFVSFELKYWVILIHLFRFRLFMCNCGGVLRCVDLK